MSVYSIRYIKCNRLDVDAVPRLSARTLKPLAQAGNICPPSYGQLSSAYA